MASGDDSGTYPSPNPTPHGPRDTGTNPGTGGSAPTEVTRPFPFRTPSGRTSTSGVPPGPITPNTSQRDGTRGNENAQNSNDNTTTNSNNNDGITEQGGGNGGQGGVDTPISGGGGSGNGGPLTDMSDNDNDLYDSDDYGPPFILPINHEVFPSRAELRARRRRRRARRRPRRLPLARPGRIRQMRRAAFRARGDYARELPGTLLGLLPAGRRRTLLRAVSELGLMMTAHLARGGPWFIPYEECVEDSGSSDDSDWDETNSDDSEPFEDEPEDELEHMNLWYEVHIRYHRFLALEDDLVEEARQRRERGSRIPRPLSPAGGVRRRDGPRRSKRLRGQMPWMPQTMQQAPIGLYVQGPERPYDVVQQLRRTWNSIPRIQYLTTVDDNIPKEGEEQGQQENDQDDQEQIQQQLQQDIQQQLQEEDQGETQEEGGSEMAG